jgi:hypothetical protein
LARIIRYDRDSYDPLDPTANRIATYANGLISLPSDLLVDPNGDLLVLDSEP